MGRKREGGPAPKTFLSLICLNIYVLTHSRLGVLFCWYSNVQTSLILTIGYMLAVPAPKAHL